MKQKLTGLFRGLTVVMASVLTLCVGISFGAFANETDINANLGTMSRKFVVEDWSDAKYPSDYDSTEEMIEAKIENIKNTMAEGIVLLKNQADADGNTVLPLSSSVMNKGINIFGRNSTDAVYGGGAGAGQVDDANIVDVKTAFTEDNIKINESLYDYYAKSSATKRGVPNFFVGGDYDLGEIDPQNDSGLKNIIDTTYSSYSDTAIIWLARSIGEGLDPPAGFMELQPEEKSLISYVEGLSGINHIIVILNEDNPIGVGSLANDDKIDAILHVGGMGINGTEALADILAGKTNPSGHLTDTYAASSLSSPAAQNMYDHSFGNSSAVEQYVGGSSEYATNYIAEEEGIYVGYKYYETRYEDSILNNESSKATTATPSTYETADGSSTWNYDNEVCYPFGYGLSYTTFSEELENVEFSTDGTITATVKVTNTGEVAGKDAVELYAQAPYTTYDKTYGVEKSAIQLMGFTKTGDIEPGTENAVEVTVTASMEFLASYDYTKAKTYILDPGDYYFAVGNGAHEALQNVISVKDSTNHSELGNSGMVKKTTLEDIEGEAYSLNTDGVDATTWATSTETGASITNLFDDANYNNIGPDNASITYVTRQDWSTFPTSQDGLTASEAMMKLLSGQASISGVDYSNGDYADVEKGSIITDAKNGVTFEDVCGVTDYDDEIWDQLLSNMSWSEMAALTQGNSLTRSVSSIGYGGSVDGDGPAGFQAGTYDEADNPEGYSGLGTRIFQSQCTLACTWNQDLAYAEGLFFGEDGIAIGYVSVWAPGCNIHRTPYSARNFEYYSEDSMMSYYMGWKECRGMQDKGVIACPKHFAFNDQEENRCSLVTLINEQEAREIQLRAFQGAFTKGGAMGTMTSFTRIGCTYAGCSHALMTDILRGEWGFKGYTITDYAAWDFMHAVETLQAGSDMFDTTMDTYSSVILTACKKGDTTTQAALREANKRVLYAYANSHVQDGVYERVWPWWESAIVALDVVLGVITLGCLAAYVSLYVINCRKAQNAAAAE
ncbi:MAG: glycoside hydrolase family 3 C-terminal domain-containing protein [Clostridia bacterium]|nr:glycoside hydrolase family 3 C-terminal domain-containing protein [Clostridia bacterium]